LRFFIEDAECNSERQAQARIAEGWTCLGLSYLKRFMQNNTYTDTKHYHQRNRRRHAKVA